MATGKVIQITGPVIDVEFPPGELPDIYNALEITRPSKEGSDGAADTLVVEVQQHLGNNWVRAVAMTTTDGLARGIPVRDTGAPITVEIDDAGTGSATSGPPAPRYADAPRELSSSRRKIGRSAR